VSAVRDSQSRYANVNAQSSYSRSNSIVNMNASANYKSSNSMKYTDQNDYSNNGSTSNLRHDDPSEMIMPRSNRRDSTG